MIRDGIRAFRLLRTESSADTLVALALLGGVAVTFLKEQR